MKRVFPITVAVALLLAASTVHGLWTDRWGTSQALLDAASRLDAVPTEIGDWTAESLDVDAASLAQAGAQTYWSRSYRSGKDKSVMVILMCGRAGRMAVHTPEVCYRGIGYEMSGGTSTSKIGGEAKSEFRTATFFRQQGTASQLRIFWAWSDGAGWQAPSSPRWHFRGAPYLYKLYIVRDVTGNAPNLNDDPAVEFIRQLTPVLDQRLLRGKS